MVFQIVLEIRASSGEEFKHEMERRLWNEQLQGDLMVVEVFWCLKEDCLCLLSLSRECGRRLCLNLAISCSYSFGCSL